ncbi:TPA: GA module-containing protein, partial [Streptococcus suis]|nr:GA module-containing protein [Streptococcus suis]
MFKIKRNKLNRQEAFNFEKRSRFGIRKLTIGVVSLVIGSGMVLNGVEQVYAGTDYEPGVEIRYARNGSPKALSSAGDFKIDTSPVEVFENGQVVHYVDVTLTFNEDGDNYTNRRFIGFNIPDSLYEPESITREIYYNAGGNQALKEKTTFSTWWHTQPSVGTTWWGTWPAYADARFIAGRPDLLSGDSYKKITGPDNAVKDTIGWQSEDKWNNQDWARLFSYFNTNGVDVRETVNRDFKDKSRTFYLNRYPASTDKFVYKFRARVKDGNAPMNFILGVNVDIANGHANFLAQYGTTPDTRTLADKSIINPSARHGVTKLEDLGSQTRNTIKQNIENANPDLFYGIHPLVTNVTVSTDGIGGNATLYFKDGSQKTIPMNQLVYKINNATGGTATASPVQTAFVNKGQGIAGYEMVGLANENHQLNLPAKKPVDSLINIENADLYLNKWNEQMTAFLGLNKTFQSWSNAWGFYNGARLYGTQNWKAEFLTAQIKYVEGSNNKRIQGIELSGPTKEYENVNIKPRNGVNTQVYGLLTPAMLFYQEDPLKTTKDEAKKTIDSIGNINGKSAEWKRRIDEAQSQQAIETIIAEARNEKNALDKKKEVAIKEINALPHLSNDEKTQAINAVTSATATTAIEQKLDEAKNLNKTNMRNKAKETINGLNKLNDDQKRPFLDRINSANTPEEIKAIIEEASFDNLKQNALDQLNNMDSAPSNKDELLQNLNNINRNDISSDGKTPAERIEAILESAKAEVLKDQAKRDINAISGLPEDKKNEFIRTVDNAQTPAEITNAVDQARAYSDYIKAKDAINKLTHLNDKQKEDLLARLEADKSQEGVTDTLATARSLDGDMKHLKDLEAQADQIKQSSDYSRADGTKQNDFDVALGAAKKVTPNGGELPTVPVSQLISDLTVAISGLDGSTQPITKDVDKANLKAEIDRSSQVKDPANAEYTYASDDKKQAYEQALTNANEVYNKTNPVATQAEVDEALGKLQAARIALDGHAPERVVDQTPPSELGGENLTNYSDVPIHGVSTIGKKIATPDTVATATVEDYGQNTTGLVEMIVVDNESAVSPASVEFTEESKNLMTMVGIKFVAYPEQKENKAIGYFTTIVPNGTLKETGAENLELKFTVANVDNARSNQFTFRYNMKDDIAPTVAETEHVLIKNQSYNISVPINDNSLFGTDGNIDKGSISIKINRDGELANAESRTPAVLGITNGENNNAWTVTPTNPQPFPNRGNRSNTGTLGFSGTATNTLTRTTYQLRVADSNKGHKMPENLSFANITFTVVDRLAAPAENAKVSVNNLSRLSSEEKERVKAAVRTANPHIATIDNAANGDTSKQVQIDVAENGRVTVTYPHGGKTDTLETAQVLKENQAPVFGTNDFLPTLWVKDKEARLQEIPTLLVFSAPTANKTAPGFPSDRQNLSAEEVTNRKLGKLPFTDPEGQALTFDPIKTLDQATIGLNVSPNGTLYGNGIGNFGPGASWTVNLKATDSQGKSKTSSEFRVVGYTDKLKDANHVTGTYGQAITENAILDKLTIDATSGLPQNFVKPNDSSYTFTVPANQYTRTITGYKQTADGQVRTVNNGVAGLPTEGTYFAEVTTTNIWGQIIKNYVKVVYQDTLAARTDLVAPEAVQIKGTTVAEDEKQTIIDALKAANPGKLPEDTRYEVASNGAVTVIYNDNSREVVNVPLKSGLPTVTTQPHDLVVFKNTDMTTPVELAGFTDNESIKDVQIVSTDGRTVDEMGLTVGEKDKENNTKSALISGKTNLPVGGNARKLRALDNLDQPSAATNDFAVRIVDATVNQPETAIEKAFGQSLTPEDVRPKINFNVGSGQDNMIDFEVIIPGNAPTSGQNKDIPVTIRTKAHANASEDFKQTFVSQDKTVTVRATWPTQAAHIEVVPPANTAPVLIDSARPTTETDKTALINALKEANKTSEGTSKFPENTTFDVAEDGTVTITYPDRSSEQVTVPFKQKDSAQHTPVVAETPIDSATTAGTSLTETERNAVKAAVTVPNFPAGDKQPTITVPDNARVTDGTNGNTGKPVVVATVEYPDGTTEQVEVPVRQRDTAKYEASVTNPEAPAAIKASHETGTQITDQADKDAILAKVSVPTGSKGTPSLDQNPVVEERDGKPVVKVTVTYPDQTTDTVYVPVDQKDNETHNPTAPAEALVAIDPTPGAAITNQADKDAAVAKVDLSKLPVGTTAAVADGAVVANDPLTNKPVVPVTVTYPDGTSEIINVPVKQADNLALAPSLKDTNPVPILTEATVGLMVSDKANLDAIAAKVDPKTGKAEVVNNTIVAGKEDGPHAGQPVVNVLVTYPDGTQDTIEVPVKQADNVANEPSLTDQIPVPIQAAATTGTPVPADDKPAILAKVDLPAGAEATIADDATVVREDGQAVVPVTVTYPDGTTDTISVPVKRADNSKYTPSQVTDTVQVDAATAPGTAITSQDDKDAIIAAVTVPKVAAGEKALVVSLPENPQVEVVNAQPVVKAIVTYADGTTDTVDVPIVQKVSATKEPSLKETEPGKPAQAVITENPTASKAITDPADQKAILDKVVVPEGGKASIADDAVVEMDGDQPVLPVTVTYTDGSKDIIKVPVKQADNVAKEPSLKNQTPVGVMDAPAVGAQVEEPTDLEAIKNNVDTKGGTASIEDPTIVEGPNNQPAVAVTVTYPDGTTDTILVPIKTADNVTYTPVLKSTVPVLVSVATDNGTAVPGADQAKILANVDVPALTADGDKPAVDLSIENPVVLQKNGQAGVEVTVTYQDGSKDKIFVPVDSDTDKDGFSNKEEEKAGTNATDPSSTPAGQDSAGQLTPGLGEPVEVKNPDKLSDAEKEAVKDAVQESNDLPAGTEVTVSDNGTVTVTYPDKSTDTIKPADTVKVAKDTDKDGFTDTEEEKAGTNATDPSSTPAGQDSAGQLTPGLGEPVEVKNPDKLSDAEKEAVKDAVQESNDLPAGTEITVSDNGTVTVTYPDKSTDTIEPAETVKATKPVSETPVTPSKPEVTSTDSGDVVVTPPTDNVTNLDITFTPEGSSQPVTVVVSKDATGTWTAPADSGLVVNPDGTITIPADKVADGTAVTVVAENGSVSSPEVGSTVVPVPVVTPETPVAPSKPEVISTVSGDVVVTPPTDNVTNLDITFTPEGSSQPVTVVVSKDATGTWTAPADSGLVVNPDGGTITIPAENVADGTAVTVVAENGSVSSPEVGSTVVPVPTPELPTIPAKPTSVTNADGSVTIVPPVENVTGLDITFTPEGATEPVTVTLGKDATGAWTAPADSGLVVNPDGTITIPADRLADGTEGQVGLVAKNGDLTSNDPAPQVPETPAKSSVETNENGSVTIVPPVENVTGIDITFTPEGASQPVTVVVSKDATGAWTAPADSGLVVNPDGTITIPADKVADGTAVSVVTKNGQVPSDEASATYVPAKPASTETPVVEVPATPSLALDGSGNVLITPPAENATSLDITFTPAGSETPITVTANKDATGNWILPETSIAVVNPDGTISISTSEMEGGTAVSVVAKNEGVPSSQAATLLVQPKQTAEELAPTVKKPIAVEDASKLTDAEKKELEDAVRKDNVLPEGTEVSVADDGTVTVTYPDKSTDTILPTKTVMDAQNGEG